MRGLGTIINVAAIVCGGGIGLLLKHGMRQRLQDILMQACGVATMFIGIGGALSGLLTVGENGSISTQKTMLLVLSMVFGSLIGELLQIEKCMERAGDKLKSVLRQKEDGRFTDGFVTATLIVCVGAMAIVGSIQDGLTGDYTMLLSKSILDFIIVLVLASTMGVGTLFSALPLGLYQGAITLCAAAASRYLSDALIADFSCVGSVLIFCVGVNIAFGKKLRVGNMLPAILVPVLFHLLHVPV